MKWSVTVTFYLDYICIQSYSMCSFISHMKTKTVFLIASRPPCYLRFWSEGQWLLLYVIMTSSYYLKLRITCYWQGLTSGLSSGQITWPDIERSCTPMERCAALLQSSTNYEQQCEPTSAAPIHTIHISSLEERKNLDFTDQLWSIVTGMGLH